MMYGYIDIKFTATCFGPYSYHRRDIRTKVMFRYEYVTFLKTKVKYTFQSSLKYFPMQ